MEAATEKQAQEPKEAILDAAERMLVSDGYAAITTRKLAAEANVNQGLIHYYFGSMEEVLLQVFERFSAQLLARQREMYAADVPFIEKWRAAMNFLDEDLAAGYPKVWNELRALAWNRPVLEERLQAVYSQWWDLLKEAFADAYEEYRLADGPLSLDAWVALVVTFNEGVLLDRLSGISKGHAELLQSIDRWLVQLERQGKR